MGRRASVCHPERFVYARGLCQACYFRDYQRSRRAERSGVMKPTIDPEREAALLKQQQGLCRICQYPPGPRNPIVMDFDFIVRQFHALLCFRCAIVLTRSLRDRDRLQSAIAYLETTKSFHDGAER